MQLLIKAIIGLLVGLVINYFSDVLPITRRISRPTCKECDKPYSFSDYIIRLKCSNCNKKRPIRPLIVVMISVGICVLLHFFPFASLSFWVTLPILAFLGIVIVIDIEHKLVLFETSITGIVLFLIYGLFMRNWLGTVVGGLIGFLIMLVFYYLGIGFTRLAGKLRKQEVEEVALGFGDVFVGTFLGFLAGPSILGGLVLAILSFGAFSLFWIIVLLISKRYRSFANAQPFAPFLILGVIATFYLPGF